MQKPNVQYKLPDEFIQKIIKLRGEQGREWIEGLPELLNTCAEKWQLKVNRPFLYFMYNYVTSVKLSDGTKAVLKICFPTDKEFISEYEALRIFDGQGAVKLINADKENGVLLLERLEPGAPLIQIKNDTKRTTIAANVMKKLWKKIPQENNFPTVSDWFKGFERYKKRCKGKSGPLPADLINKAEMLFQDLIATSDEPVLLHGDLHYYNIISSKREWFAIDPKGVVGEPAYETGALIRNPLPELLRENNPRQILNRRINHLSEELGFEKDRIKSWSFAQAVLAGIWELEDQGHGWKPFTDCAKLLND